MGVMFFVDVIFSIVLTFLYMRNVRYECYYIIIFFIIVGKNFCFCN